MHASLFSPILRLSYLHLISYGLVAAVILVALADVYVIRSLRKALRRESASLRNEPPDRGMLDGCIHPVARSLSARAAGASPLHSEAARRDLDLAEASLFVPLRSRMSLTRDLSTLMGLIATLLALVAAASDFAKHGQPELLIGSVGTGCVATCVAAIGCAIALWNLSKLTRLRLEVACESEDLLRQWERREDGAAAIEVPIEHVVDSTALPCNSEIRGPRSETPQRNHFHARL